MGAYPDRPISSNLGLRILNRSYRHRPYVESYIDTSIRDDLSRRNSSMMIPLNKVISRIKKKHGKLFYDFFTKIFDIKESTPNERLYYALYNQYLSAVQKDISNYTNDVQEFIALLPSLFTVKKYISKLQSNCKLITKLTETQDMNNPPSQRDLIQINLDNSNSGLMNDLVFIKFGLDIYLDHYSNNSSKVLADNVFILNTRIQS